MSSKYRLLKNRGFRCDFNPNRSLGLAWILFFRRKDYSYRLFQTLLLCSWRVSSEGVHMSGIWHMPKNPPRRGERFPLMWGFIPHGRGEILSMKMVFFGTADIIRGFMVSLYVKGKENGEVRTIRNETTYPIHGKYPLKHWKSSVLVRACPCLSVAVIICHGRSQTNTDWKPKLGRAVLA